LKDLTLKEARELLGLGETATRQEIVAAYRRAARRWHPDRAPEGREAEFRARMQQVNAAYQRLKDFLEGYRFRLEDLETLQDAEEWWRERFYTGVWTPPPGKSGEPTTEPPDQGPSKIKAGTAKKERA